MLQTNNAGQNQGLIAWTGTVATPRDISTHLYNSFDFEVTADLTADAVFNVMAYGPDPADPCAPLLPGTQVTVKPFCDPSAVATPGVIRILSGTKKGTRVTATLACRPGKFIGLQHVSGGADVRAVLLLSAPTR